MTAQQAPWADGTLVTTATMNAIMTALGLDPLAGLNTDGWVDDNVAGSWTVTSGTTFTVATGAATQVTRYPVGAKLSCTQGGSGYYGYVVSATYGGGTTTVTGVWNLANGTAANLSVGSVLFPRISYMATPYGFPGSFVFVPTAVTGWSGSPTVACRFAMSGRVVTVWYYIDGTSNGSSASCTLPFTAAAATKDWLASGGQCFNSGSFTANASCGVIQNTATMYWNLSGSGSGWTTSAEKQVYGQITFPI